MYQEYMLNDSLVLVDRNSCLIVAGKSKGDNFAKKMFANARAIHSHKKKPFKIQELSGRWNMIPANRYPTS